MVLAGAIGTCDMSVHDPMPPKPRERVVPPGAVVHLLAHGVAELAVVGDVDASLGLTADDLDRRVAQLLLVLRLVVRLLVDSLAIQLDQIVRTRKAPRVTRENVIAVLAHRAPSCVDAAPAASRGATPKPNTPSDDRRLIGLGEAL